MKSNHTFDVDNITSYNYSKSSMTENRNLIYDIVNLVKPKKILELGTYTGCSYFSFAQAVKDLDLPTKLIGVDTWRGDQHTGFYDNTIFQTFTSTRKTYFADDRFQIIRAKFNDAIKLIEDNSIDILLIDGLHTAEAVKEDYDNFLPKLTQNGIVLFHDTRVARFTLKEFWGDISSKFPSYNVPNQYGFGILAPKGDENFRRIMSDINDIPSVAIYSAIYGGKDNIIPEQVEQNIPTDYIMFSDADISNSGKWKVITGPKSTSGDPRMEAKYFKLMPHEVPELAKYDYLIWVDGLVQVTNPDFSRMMVDTLRSDAVGLMSHPDRNCIYEEFDECVRIGKIKEKEDVERAFNQLKRYKKIPILPNAGLYAATVLIRNAKHKLAEKFNKTWWQEVTEGSFRDQLSLPYVIKTSGITPVPINLVYNKNIYFTRKTHVR